DDLLHARVVVGQRHAAEGDERRVDVRARPEDGSRYRMEAGALADELNEHGDRAVGLRARLRKQTVGDLALNHDAPEPDIGETVEPSDHLEDVAIGEEVLPVLLLHRQKHALALTSICAARSPTPSPRAWARAATVWTTYAGSLRRPRTGCGAR